MSDRAYTMRQAQRMIEDTIMFPLKHSNRTIFLVGPPGIGKTAMAYALFNKFKRTDENPNGFTHSVPYVCPEREPTEWGLPWVNHQDKTITMMPLDEFKFGPEDRVFFLFDEVDKSNNMMQNVIARVAHEHRVYNITLPPGSLVMMAGNRLTDRAGGFTANSHIKNRRTHIPVCVDHKEWIEDVGLPFSLHSSVVSYIRTDPKILHVFDPAAEAFPSPRSWTKVGEQLNYRAHPDTERAFIEGDIGVDAANTFWGHLTIHRELRSPEVIIADPEGAPIPKGANATARIWAEVTALARYATEDNADRIFRYFNRLDGEYSFCGYKDVLSIDPKAVYKSKNGSLWMIKNATTLKDTQEK